MSETVTPEGVNININNSDSNASNGGQSFLDRIFDLGIKILIPLLLVFAVIAIVIVVKVVLPLVGFVIDLSDEGIPVLGLLGPIGGLIGGVGSVLGWVVGR